MIWNEYPYSNVHELNLDWIIKKVHEYLKKVDVLEIDFKDLKDYILNFFDNLDLQEEVNNKLDEMYEDGQLTTLIQQWLESQGLMVYDTIDDLKASVNVLNNQNIMTLGFGIKGDKLGRIYKVREVLTTDIIDDFNIVALSNPSLVAEKINMWGEENVLTHKRYYIDNLNGDDKNDGLSSSTAFKTLDRFFELANSQSELRAYLIHTGKYDIHNINVLSSLNIHIQDTIGGCIINFTTDDSDVAVYGGHYNLSCTDTTDVNSKLTIQVNDGANNIYFDNSFLVASRVIFTDNLLASGIASLNNCEAQCIDFSYGYIRIGNGFKIKNEDGNKNGITLNQTNMTTAGAVSWANLTYNIGGTGIGLYIGRNSSVIFGNVPNEITNKYSVGVKVEASLLRIQKNRYDGFSNIGTQAKIIETDSNIIFTNDGEYIGTDYNVNDVINIDNLIAYGYVTGGATSLRLTIPLVREISRTVSDASLSLTNLSVRGSSGVINLTGNEITINTISITATGIYLDLRTATAISGLTNNSSITAVFYSSTITLT